MDPAGPWYASYNRIAAGVQPNTGSPAELHHHLTTGGTSTAVPSVATTTAQILPGFLSPPPVTYETVFSPLFHHAAAAAAGAKPSSAAAAHYVNQHRALAAQAAAAKQPDGEFHQQFFEQNTPPNAWQQTSPFGILPHESVVATTTKGTTPYENFNAHFAAAQSLNQLNSKSRAQSPTPVKSNVTSSSFFQQVPVTFSDSTSNNNNNNSSKSFTSSSCIVSSPSTATATVSKEYHRVPQTPSSSRAFLTSPTARNVTAASKQTSIQTKAQTKIYPDIQSSERTTPRSNEENVVQSSPISFSIMDVPGRLNYSGSNSSGKRPPQFQGQQNYRHFITEDFQRPKNSSEFNNSGPDCNVVVPRRPSPLQAHSQASPIGHAPSPAYPLYNSPMNSISSPQQQNSSNSSQVTPPSPLDVTVPRPNSQSSGTGSGSSNSSAPVAYPSVITKTTSFPAANSQNQTTCWDDRQQRKYNNYNNDRERTQPYFETVSTHQVPLQDLSSCRGDPMTIVKNLQNQQSCQVAAEIKQEVKVKRRKSSEKSILDGRIPPPAHSALQQQQQSQQQNGGGGGGATPYFDFDRWNLPASKIFSTPPNVLHQQHHQGLMVPHPHGHHSGTAPPPLPYFAPFHVGGAPAGEFGPAGVEMYDHQFGQQGHMQQQQQLQQQAQVEEDHPKVVVPNIEEELNFLSEDVKPTAADITINVHKQTPPAANPPIVKPASEKSNGPSGAGFMSSYLKFLQGERDTSPPPTVRGNRKQSWPRTKPNLNPDGSSSNEPILPPPPHQQQQQMQQFPISTIRLSQGDPQDDPRYFPLPKERKRNSFDSSDDGFSSDDDFFVNKMKSLAVPPVIKTETPPVATEDIVKQKGRRKGRPCKPGGPTERKKLKEQERLQRKQEKQLKLLEKEKLREAKLEAKAAAAATSLPRRETSKRAAKEKNNLHNMMEETDEMVDFQDSDSDPAWTPAAKNEEEDAAPMKQKRRGRPRKIKNLIEVAAQGAGIQDVDGYGGNDNMRRKTKLQQSSAPTLEDNIAASLQNSDDNPFKAGEFVVIKSDLSQEWPAIWRVDGKSLLQKYEPFDQAGTTLYRNRSTYTSWTPESKKQYMSVPVRHRTQGQLETIVELLKNEITIIDTDYQEYCMKQSELYQDNFEVYIQTLISQALDSNFLMEIFQEKDEYFLTNVQTIDEITDSKKQKLLGLLRWPLSVQVAISTWPCFNVIREVNVQDVQSRHCAACDRLGVGVRVLMYGQPYNSTTLEGSPPDPNAVHEKDFLMCRICANRVELFNKVTHQKYLMYIECAKRVAEKRLADPTKDTTCILNELLADENWLNQLFTAVRTVWSDIDCIENSLKTKNNLM